DAVIVATGGARGVTAHTLIALARAHGGKYALLGRTALEDEPSCVAGLTEEPALKRALLQDAMARGEKVTPADIGRKVSRILANREIRATLDAMRAAGAEARYVPADVNDAGRLGAVLDEIRGQWGPIGGLVHGAGVLADKLVADKTVDQWNMVFDTKVAGLITLLGALKDDPLRAIVMFASVAGRCGNRGQSDYAAANEVLAKVAALEAKRRPDCVVKALQWGPWEGGMVTPQLARQFAAMGVPLIPLDVGAGWLVSELSDRTGNVEIVLGNEPLMGPLAGHSADASAAGPHEHKVTLRVRLSPGSHPHLADHEVGGVPVVPVVLALEWFARAAAACRPDLSLAVIRDVKVLRGLKLDHFADGEWLDISARETSNGDGAVLALELSRVGGALHYTARAQMVARRTAVPAKPHTPRTEPFQGDVYDGSVLFHGPRFHVIRSVDGIGDDGLVATLDTTAEMAWPDEAWRTDPAAFDGGLQLALIWTRRVLGGASLPMGVAALHTFADGVPTGPLTATLRGEKRGRDRTVTNVVFADAKGGVVAQLEGVEAILRPDAR
ncbi:MAG: SDR family NAD(P)-dependent oxidoreductase, partial [Myxococcales bacterium]|nr:SDR family NAD(P)-dependent oxidoreductase [Myxococcales bacterium]